MPAPQQNRPTLDNFNMTMHSILAAFNNFQNVEQRRNEQQTNQRGRRNRGDDAEDETDEEEEEWEDIDEEEEEGGWSDEDEEEDAEEDDDESLGVVDEDATEEGPSADIREVTESKEEFMCCNHCSFPLCDKSMFFPDQIDVDSKTVYSYELEGDVLGLESVWVYSATNPSSNRFDVARVKPKLNGRGLRCDKKFSPEYSWFPGYEWANCTCASCGQHMGWGFRPIAEAENDSSASKATQSTPAPLAFVGLIITNTKNLELTKSEIRDKRRNLSSVEVANNNYWSQRDDLMRMLRAMPDQLTGNALGMMVRNMDNNPAERRNLSALHAAVAAMRQVAAVEEESRRELPMNSPDDAVSEDSNFDDVIQLAMNESNEGSDESGEDSDQEVDEEDVESIRHATNPAGELDDEEEEGTASSGRPVMREID